MRDTRAELLMQAETLVRGRGFAGFSYADLAAAGGGRPGGGGGRAPPPPAPRARPGRPPRGAATPERAARARTVRCAQAVILAIIPTAPILTPPQPRRRVPRTGCWTPPR